MFARRAELVDRARNEAGTSESVFLDVSGAARRLFDPPTVTANGPLGEMSVLPSKVELSEFKLGPRFSGDPNGESKLDWSVFTSATVPELTTA